MKTGCLLYADDVKLFHRVGSDDDVALLQADLDNLHNWCKTWKLKLNPVKCQTITFTLRTSPIQSTYSVNGHELTRCQEVRVLGILLDNKPVDATTYGNVIRC